jgi:hypothetical protein
MWFAHSMSPLGLGCVKTRFCSLSQELFSLLCSHDKMLGVLRSETEMEILRFKTASEFSHNLGQNPPPSPALVCLLPPAADMVRENVGQATQFWLPSYAILVAVVGSLDVAIRDGFPMHGS